MGKRQNADPKSVDGPWTTLVDHSHGPFSWTTRKTPDFGGLHD